VELLPEELRDVVSDFDPNKTNDATDSAGVSAKKNVAFLKKRRIDKLARFDESADLDAAGADKDDDEVDENDDGGEDIADMEDDHYTEDEEDLDNDYNGEKYFDDGDDIDDDGGDEGGEDAW
jgi:DNA-directed RNA polymerase III subunit RPC7